MAIDKIDSKILEHLQEDARISNLELASRIGLSPTPCAKRVRKLESDGVIKGYHASIDSSRLGLNISAIVLVRLGKKSRREADEFAAAVLDSPSIVDCYMVSGRIDYIIRVLARDLSHYEEIIKDEISNLPHLVEMESLFILGDVSSRF